MIRSVLGIAIAAATFATTPIATPQAKAQDLGDIVGGVAKQYLNQEQDRAAYAQAQQQNTAAAYRSYLRQFPDGAYAAQAENRLEQLGGSTASSRQPRAVEPTAGAGSNGLTSQQRREVQRRLTALGYDTSGTDGAFGPGTRRAIALWQRDRNYSQTGTLTSAQSRELLSGGGGGGGSTSGGTSAAAATGPAQAEAALGLSVSQRSAVQVGLTQRGFDTRGVDGSFGRGTRNAIASWQRANDFSETGYLTADQVSRLTR